MPKAFPQTMHYFDCAYTVGRNSYSEDALCTLQEADVLRGRLLRKAKARGEDIQITIDMTVHLVEPRQDGQAALYKGTDADSVERFVVAEPYENGGWKVAAQDPDEANARDQLDGYC
jgi:hypothetical protein